MSLAARQPPGASPEVTEIDPETKAVAKHSMCTACGHSWHWTEAFFILMFFVGAAFTVVSIVLGESFPPVIIIIFGAVTAVIAFGHVWNLCTARRLGLAADSLLRTVEVLNRENARALATCERIKAQNDVFKMDLFTLETSRKLIGKSVVSLDAAAKKQDAFIEETRQIIERREKFGEELRALLSTENKNAAKQAKMNLKEMITNVVFANDLTASEGSGLLPTSASAEWSDKHLDSLRKVLARENIAWSADLDDALADGLTQYELFSTLDVFLDLHFDALDADYGRLKELEAESLRLELEIGRVKKQNLEKRVALQEKDLMSMQRAPVNIVGEDLV